MENMPIRRLRLDDEEEEEDEQHPQPQPHTFTHQPPNSTNFLISNPVLISDDEDFIDVSGSLSPHPPPPPPPPVPEPQASGCPVSDYLRRLGLGLKSVWLSGCLRELQNTVRGFEGFDVAAKAKLYFEQFLLADLNYCGSSVLPPNVHSMHLAVLSGPFGLQVDEIINMSCSLPTRYNQAPAGHKRCLKLSMTDGIQRVFGLKLLSLMYMCAADF